MSVNIADEITEEYNKYIREVIDYGPTNKPITRLDIGCIVSAVTFAAGYQIASTKRAIRITELEAKLAGAGIREMLGAFQVYRTPQALAAPSDESIAWEAPAGSGFIRYVTDEKYKKFAPAVQGHYRPFKCSKCSIQALTPITADDVSDACVRELWAIGRLTDSGHLGKADVLVYVNTFIKHRSEAK